MKIKSKKHFLKRLITLYIPLAIFLIFTLFPIYWMILTSLKPSTEIFSRNIDYIPKNPTLIHFKNVWENTNFSRYFLNSLFVAFSTGFVTVISAIFGGYSFSRYRYKGKNAILFFFLVTQMLPFVLLIIPLYVIFAKIGLTDNLIALILSYTALNIPFCTIMMVGFFDGVPISIEECARVDGANLLQTMTKITFPLVLPGISATFIFAFIFAWNELLLGVMFIDSESLQTLPVGLSTFIQRFNILWGQMSAAGTMALIPVVILFFIAQKQLVKGLTLGSVKG